MVQSVRFTVDSSPIWMLHSSHLQHVSREIVHGTTSPHSDTSQVVKTSPIKFKLSHSLIKYLSKVMIRVNSILPISHISITQFLAHHTTTHSVGDASRSMLTVDVDTRSSAYRILTSKEHRPWSAFLSFVASGLELTETSQASSMARPCQGHGGILTI